LACANLASISPRSRAKSIGLAGRSAAPTGDCLAPGIGVTVGGDHDGGKVRPLQRQVFVDEGREAVTIDDKRTGLFYSGRISASIVTPYMGRLKSSANFMVLPFSCHSYWRLVVIGRSRSTPTSQAAADHLT
jgi:hypothetical protein